MEDKAVVNVPGQRGGNITMCAAISLKLGDHRQVTLSPYSTAHMITF